MNPGSPETPRVLVVAARPGQVDDVDLAGEIRRCVRCRARLVLYPAALRAATEMAPDAEIDVACIDCTPHLSYENLTDEVREAFASIAATLKENGRRARY